MPAIAANWPTHRLLFERCVAIWKELGDSADIARALSNLANVVKLQGEYARASSLYGECLTMFRKAGDGAGVAWTLELPGRCCSGKADLAAAHVHFANRVWQRSANCGMAGELPAPFPIWQV